MEASRSLLPYAAGAAAAGGMMYVCSKILNKLEEMDKKVPLSTLGARFISMTTMVGQPAGGEITEQPGAHRRESWIRGS